MKMNQVRSQIQSMLHVESGADGFRATFKADSDFMLFRDHFRGRPVVPGISLIQAVLLAGAAHEGADDLRLCALKNAKFFAAVLPDDQVLIDAAVVRGEDSTVDIKANLTVNQKRLAQIALTARPAPAGR